MKDLVILKNSVPLTTSLIIAEGVDIEHRAVMQLIDTYLKDLSDIDENNKTFEMLFKRKKGVAGKPTRYCELTEMQSTFLVTLMKNSKVVVKFKKGLSRQFIKIRDELSRIASQQNNEQWKAIRQSGKIDRRIETDSIKEFIDYATKQGSSSAKRYYANLSKMENKALFLVEHKYKNLRDVLGEVDLLTVQQADRIVSKALKDGMNDKLDYHDIYKLCKKRIEMFAELRGKSALNYLSCDTKELK